MSLKDKVILITGGSGGIGGASAVECAKQGAKAVYITYLASPDRAAAVVASINASGSAGYSIRADVSKKAEADVAARTVGEQQGRIDAVACYAGHPMDKDSWFGEFLALSEEQISKPLDVDVRGSFFTAQAVLPFMLEAGKGSVVLVSSTPGLVGDTQGIAYALGKAAVANLARCLAKTFGPRGIRANAIAPGSIGTPANLASLSKADYDMLASESSLRRFGSPEDVAKLAAHLMSDDSAFTTGQTLVCDGGTVFR